MAPNFIPLTEEKWLIFGVRTRQQLERFITQLDHLFPNGSILVLDVYIPEGERLPRSIDDVMRANQGQWDTAHIVRMPIPLTQEYLSQVPRLLDVGYSSPLESLYVYYGDEMLMWGVELGQQGFEVSVSIPEDAVKAFCESVLCLYKRVKETPVDTTEKEYWEIEDELEPLDCIRNLHLLESSDGALAIPVWVSDGGTNLLSEDVFRFFEMHTPPDRYVLPWTREDQEEEVLVRALDIEQDTPPCPCVCSWTHKCPVFPDDLQMEITKESMQQLASLMESEESIINDFYVRVGRQLLVWFSSGKMSVEIDVPEDRMAAFCNALGCRYTRVKLEMAVSIELKEPAEMPRS